MFLEFKARRTRPETARYNEWNKQKQDKDFKFREVLPFGGIIKKGGALGRQARDDFEKKREQDFEGVVFQPDSAWGRARKVRPDLTPRTRRRSPTTWTQT